MSISIATLGMYTPPGIGGGGGGGGGAPPVHQYEVRGEDFATIKVKTVKFTEAKEITEINIKVNKVYSDRHFDD